MKNFGVQRAVTGPCACDETGTIGQSLKAKIEESVTFFALQTSREVADLYRG
jgi:hypothetical protein